MMEYLDQSEGLFNRETGEILLRFEVRGTRYEGRTEQIEKVQLFDDVLVRRDEKNSFNANNFELLTTAKKALDTFLQNFAMCLRRCMTVASCIFKQLM